MIEVPTLIEDPRGAIYLNPAAEQVGGRLLVPPAGTLVIPGRSTAVPGRNFTQIESSSNENDEILSLWGPYSESSTDHDRMQVLIKDGAHSDRELMNRYVNLLHVFGTVQNPFYLDREWAASLYLKAQQLLTMQFQSTGLTTNITLDMPAFEATGIFGNAIQNSKDLMRDVNLKQADAINVYPYWFTMQNNITGRYDTAGLTLAASTFADAQFFNQRDDLVLLLTTVLATAISTGSTGDLEAKATFEIFTPYDEIALQDQPVAFNCGAGIGAFPHRLSCPLVIQPKDQFRVRFANLVTNANTEIFFTFFGVAVRGNHRVATKQGGF